MIRHLAQRAATKAASSTTRAPVMLQRKCACGAHTPGGETCARCTAMGGLQRKLSIGASNDPLEQEADRVADRALTRLAPNGVARAPLAIQRFTPHASEQREEAPASVDRALGAPGSALGDATRRDMEHRFGHDFSRVRVHHDAAADESARDVDAQAYTVGNHIFFGAGRFAPETSDGRRLLAHELTHSLQQSRGFDRLIQREGIGDLRLSESCEEIKVRIRATAACVALDAKSKALADDIIAVLDKHPLNVRYGLLVTLETLFTVPPKAPATISIETKAATATATTQEQKRLAKPVEAKNRGIEEAASAKVPGAGAWTPIRGKFGNGTYYVDRRSYTDIHIRASIYLHPTGTGTVHDVNRIKSMEDAIEKAASTKGYSVDIRFVPSKTADAFDVEVDPSRWEVATNWSGGAPRGFAHELHHLFAFELDKYNYIEAHSKNESMAIDQRLIWFRKELDKPQGYNDPTSIMGSAAHANDSDACTVAGLDFKACMDARAKAKKP